MQQVERWARYVKEHPLTWKAQHTEFINAIYEKASDAIVRISKERSGREKIMQLYKIKNEKGYPTLLKQH
ncbi:hypothetical protein HY489_01060 [Candidatus Woesearchaeota archaeon]|nr:hypothetical protein [Candidatus Woesearchaeota archaeon]